MLVAAPREFSAAIISVTITQFFNPSMKALETAGILGITGAIIIGAMLGIAGFESHGTLAAIAGSIVGSVAGLFLGLNSVSVIQVVGGALRHFLGKGGGPPANKNGIIPFA